MPYVNPEKKRTTEPTKSSPITPWRPGRTKSIKLFGLYFDIVQIKEEHRINTTS